MYLNEKATISIQRYDHLCKIEKAVKQKKMFLKDYDYNGQEFYNFDNIQEGLFKQVEKLLKEKREAEKEHYKEIQELKGKNKTFVQKLKNLFK